MVEQYRNSKILDEEDVKAKIKRLGKDTVDDFDKWIVKQFASLSRCIHAPLSPSH